MSATLSRLLALKTLILAGAAAYSMSTLFSAMKPIVLTRTAEQLGLSDGLASLIAAMPFVGIASAALLAAPLVTRLSLTQLTCTFGALLIAAELVSAQAFESVPVTLLLQFLAGLSVGILMGATSKVIATSDSADEVFGVVDMTAVLLMSVMISTVSIAVEYNGLEGAYLAAAGISALFALLMLAHRSPAPTPIASDSPTLEPLHVGIRELSVVAMAVTFVTFSGVGFAYMFTIAKDLGMGYAVAGEQIGWLLFASAFACLAGGWCSARFGPARPLAAAFITCAVGWLIASTTQSQIIYIAALVPAVFSLQFCFPVLLALSGSLDRDGRWAAIATPVQTSGFAWAAILAGQVVGVWGTQVIGIVTSAGMAICLALLWLSREKTPAQLARAT
ncbi:MAG: MFS transporter [Pseudomonadaceae bacterium]|nr:MFS transporter [Pseudomonadaceae bacterium]